jgi:hypothetical protein
MKLASMRLDKPIEPGRIMGYSEVDFQFTPPEVGNATLDRIESALL